MESKSYNNYKDIHRDLVSIENVLIKSEYKVGRQTSKEFKKLGQKRGLGRVWAWLRGKSLWKKLGADDQKMKNVISELVVLTNLKGGAVRISKKEVRSAKERLVDYVAQQVGLSPKEGFDILKAERFCFGSAEAKAADGSTFWHLEELNKLSEDELTHYYAEADLENMQGQLENPNKVEGLSPGVISHRKKAAQRMNPEMEEEIKGKVAGALSKTAGKMERAPFGSDDILYDFEELNKASAEELKSYYGTRELKNIQTALKGDRKTVVGLEEKLREVMKMGTRVRFQDEKKEMSFLPQNFKVLNKLGADELSMQLTAEEAEHINRWVESSTDVEVSSDNYLGRSTTITMAGRGLPKEVVFSA